MTDAADLLPFMEEEEAKEVGQNDAAVDLSFSQFLDMRSMYQQQQRQHQERHFSAPSSGLPSVDESAETVEGIPVATGRSISISSEEDEDWTNGGDGQLGQDVYRFVQPRRLSSWVQDDAVNACFRCHTPFSLLVRKHHCRACGRIFCASCSSQRVVIPLDYESTPVSPQYNSLTTNASDLIGNLGWYILSYSPPTSDAGSSYHPVPPTHILDSSSKSPAEDRQQFLKEVQKMQRTGALQNFTPSSQEASNPKSPHIQEGSVLQRVCDDCASALQQRRQHHNIVRVFELCEFNLQELRTLGLVCRKWHRASIMCLSMFRQIQYYLPSHQLSTRERAQLLINRQFLPGHSKWIVQLVRAVGFHEEEESDLDHSSVSLHPPLRNTPSHSSLANEVLELVQQPRQHKCMLTMCSRLCESELSPVDALELLADDNIRSRRLRTMCVDALKKKATEREWWSYLPVLLHALSCEMNASGSELGKALLRQAQCDVRFCYDLYWGLTVRSEDACHRRRFDELKQRLLLTLATSSSSKDQGDLPEQLLKGQQFVDLMHQVPHNLPVEDVREILEKEVKSGKLLDEGALRLPVDPLVKTRSIDFQSIEIKRSAEAPMVIKCQDVDREEDGDEEALDASASHRNEYRKLARALPYYRLMYKRDDLRKDAIVQNIINVMYLILKQETKLDIPLVTYRVLPTSSFDGLIEIVENAHTLYSIIRDHGTILNFLHHYNGHRTLSEISASFRESLAAYTVITFLLGVGDRHADNVMLTKDGILFHIDYGFILGKDPKPLQPPMRLDHYMIEALGGAQTPQFEQFKQLCVAAFNCLRRHVSLCMILLTLVVRAAPEITDFGVNYTQADLEAFVVERFLPGQSDEEAATALMLRMEGKLNEKIGLKLSDFVHAHANEKTVSKGMVSVGSSVKIGVEAMEATVSTVATSLTSGASTFYKYMWGAPPR